MMKRSSPFGPLNLKSKFLLVGEGYGIPAHTTRRFNGKLYAKATSNRSYPTPLPKTKAQALARSLRSHRGANGNQLLFIRVVPVKGGYDLYTRYNEGA